MTIQLQCLEVHCTLMYQSYNSSCLNDRIVGISNETLYQASSEKRTSASPGILKLYGPAKCVSNNSVSCDKYYIDNIMLGEEIAIHSCLLQ